MASGLLLPDAASLALISVDVHEEEKLITATARKPIHDEWRRQAFAFLPSSPKSHGVAQRATRSWNYLVQSLSALAHASPSSDLIKIILKKAHQYLEFIY